MEEQEKLILNDEITHDQLKYTIEAIKYNFHKLKAYLILLPYFRNLKLNSQENDALVNALIESSLLTMRVLYEFFFVYEINKKDIKKINKKFKEKSRTKDDVIAEYYYEKPEKWWEIKSDNNIRFEKMSEKIDWEKLNKGAIHLTFAEKQSWDVIPVIVELVRIIKIFFDTQDKLTSLFD